MDPNGFIAFATSFASGIGTGLALAGDKSFEDLLRRIFWNAHYSIITKDGKLTQTIEITSVFRVDDIPVVKQS